MKTIKSNTSSIANSRRVMYFIMILFMLLSGVGIQPVSAAATTTYTISGNAGVATATITYTGGTTTANSAGDYSFTVASGWSGTVIPSKTGYGFRPATHTYTNLASNQVSQDYKTAAASRVYYVDNTVGCSDSGQVGSLALPFCQIARGANFATAGQIVYVLHGTYAETVYPKYNGTAGSPVTFWADPGVTVTGQAGTLIANYSAFALSGKSYVVIDGFTVDNTSGQGIYVDSSDHITITNNHVSHSGASSLYHPYEQGIYLKGSTYSTISGNITDHNTCIGIRLHINSNNNLVSNNISFSNYSVIETDAAGIETSGSSYNTIINNVTYNNEDSGINIYLYKSDTVPIITVPSTHNLVIDNLSYENGDHGIDTNNSPYNTYIGNTVQGNGTVGINVEGESGTGSTNTTLFNNIISGNGFTPPTGSFGGNLRVDSASITGTMVNYDLFNRESATVQIIWDNTNYTSLAAFQAAWPLQEVKDQGLEGDPLFVSPVPSVLRSGKVPYVGAGVVGNYYLKPGSPAIDSAYSDAPSQPLKDIDGNGRVDDPATQNTGAGVRTYDDRGAYEFLPSQPTVTTQAVTNITMTTATGNGNVIALGSPNPTQHGVVWNTTGAPTTADSKTTDGAVSGTGAFTSAMTGLISGTLYHVRAYATNAVGTVYGGEVTFTALLAPTVTTQAVTNIAMTTATGNGNVTALGTPNPTQHGVVWSTLINPTILDSHTTDGPVSVIGAFTSSITGLTPGTLYHVRAYATNAAGTSYGDDLTFTASLMPTTTSVICGGGTPLVTFGSSISCVAIVVRGSVSKTPTGNVTWTTNGSGSFVTSPCLLAGTNGTAACSVTYTPSTVDASPHLITATYAGDPNFYTSSGSQLVTVNPKAITVTANTGQSKVFGAADPAFSYTSSDPAVVFTGTLNRTLGENVGAYAITIGSLSAGNNYTVSFVSKDFSITAKPITVTANTGQSKVFGAADPVFSYTSSDPTVVFTGALSRLPGENVGSYALTIGNLSAGSNYNLTFVSKDFTITAVNHGPVITEGASVGVTMSKNSTPIPFSLTLNATDMDSGDTLTWSVSNPAGHGTASANGNGSSKAITYTPVLDYVGTDSFVVQVSDGKGGIATITVNLTITGVGKSSSFTTFLPAIQR